MIGKQVLAIYRENGDFIQYLLKKEAYLLPQICDAFNGCITIKLKILTIQDYIIIFDKTKSHE